MHVCVLWAIQRCARHNMMCIVRCAAALGGSECEGVCVRCVLLYAVPCVYHHCSSSVVFG